MREKTKTHIISELPFLPLSLQLPSPSNFLSFFPFVVVWVYQMRLLSEILEGTRVIPQVHYIQVWKKDTSLAAHQPQESTRHKVQKLLVGTAASPGQPIQQDTESQGSLGKLLEQALMTAEQSYLAVWSQGHLTSPAQLQLSTTMQTSVDSLGFSWLKHRLAPNSLPAHNCWESKWHKSNHSTHARTHWPINRQNKDSSPLSLLS